MTHTIEACQEFYSMGFMHLVSYFQVPMAIQEEFVTAYEIDVSFPSFLRISYANGSIYSTPNSDLVDVKVLIGNSYDS